VSAVTIQELGSLGELVAAIATVATLIYLALQIRRNTQATRAASFHAITDSMNHVNVSVAQNPGIARIWLAGTADRSSLSEEERHQYDLVLLSYFHVFETMHYQARVGAGEKDLLLGEERSLAALLSTPGVREWWAQNPYAFGPEFRSYVERFLATSPEEPSRARSP
jgi:hypothetical protein